MTPEQPSKRGLHSLRFLLPTRRQLAEYSPALIAASWLLLTWEWRGTGYLTIPLALLAGALFQAILLLFLGLASILVSGWLRVATPNTQALLPGNPQVLGALCLIVALWIYHGYHDRRDNRALIGCLEGRAEWLRAQLREGHTLDELEAELYSGDRLSLEPGGMRWAVKSCQDQLSATYDDE